MRFKDFELKSDNHFIAMQYYGLILNRTYLVLVTNDRIIGLKVNRLVSVESGGHILAKELSKTMTVKGDLQNPYSYVKSKYLDRLQDLELVDAEILKQDKSNFVIQQADITNAYYDPKRNGAWVIIRMTEKCIW